MLDSGRVADFGPLIDAALLRARDHRSVEEKTGRHSNSSHVRKPMLIQRRLRIGLRDKCRVRQLIRPCRRADWRSVRERCMMLREAGLSFEMKTLMRSVKRRSSALLMCCGALAALTAALRARPWSARRLPRRPRPAAGAARPAAKPAVAAKASRARRAGPEQSGFQGRPAGGRPGRARCRRRCRPPCGTWPAPQQLLAYIQQIGVEGLNPADYDPGGLAGRDPDRAIRR